VIAVRPSNQICKMESLGGGGGARIKKKKLKSPNGEEARNAPHGDEKGIYRGKIWVVEDEDRNKRVGEWGGEGERAGVGNFKKKVPREEKGWRG